MLSYFRTRKQNEEIARDELNDQLRTLRLEERKNTIKQRIVEKTLENLKTKNLLSTNSQVAIQLKRKQLLENDQQRIIRSNESLQTKLINLNSAGTTLSELNMLPTYAAATKVSTKSVLKAQKLMNKIEQNTTNQESLEDVLLTEVDSENLSNEWEYNLEQAQADELELKLIEKRKQKLNVKN